MNFRIGSLVGTALRTSGVLFLRLVLLACTLLILTRLLGPAAFGAFAGTAAIAVIAGSLASLGTHLVVMRNTARSPTEADESLRYATWATALGAGLMFSGYLLAIAALGPKGIDITSILAIGIADAVLHPFLQLASARLLGRGHVARSQAILAVPLALRFIAAAALMLAGAENALATYALCYALCTLVSLAWARAMFGRLLPPLQSWRPPAAAEWKDARGYALLNVTAAAPGELDKALSLRLMPADGAGLYAAASRVVGALVLPVAALMLSALPRLFSADPGRDRRLVPTILLSSCVYGLLAGLLIHAAAAPIESALGAGYEGAEGILSLLAIAVPGMALRLAGTTTLMAQGHPLTRALVEGLGLVTLALGAVALGTAFHEQALPLAFVISEWSMALSAWIILWRAGRLRTPRPAG